MFGSLQVVFCEQVHVITCVCNCWSLGSILFATDKNGKSPAQPKKKEKKEKEKDRDRAGSKLSANDIEVVSNNSSSAAVSDFVHIEVSMAVVVASS